MNFKKVQPLSSDEITTLNRMQHMPLSASISDSLTKAEFKIADKLAQRGLCKLDYCCSSKGVQYSITEKGKRALISFKSIT